MDESSKRKRISKTEVRNSYMSENNKEKKKTNNIKKIKIINGSILEGKYIPEELLIEIFCCVDHKTLLACQLVCRYWQSLIKPFVWHKVAVKNVGCALLYDKRTSWMAYYSVCSKMPFNKNLIKNDSGQNGNIENWQLPPINGINWFIEKSPVPALLEDALFPERDHCFVTSSGMTWKFQVIDLIKEGFSSYLLDYLQPPIKVSEWYCCQNAPSKYICDIEFLKDNGEKKCIFYKESENSLWKTVSDHYTFSDVLEVKKQNKWFRYEHEFKNYGRGLRKIKFIHGGRYVQRLDSNQHREHGCKTARACVKIDLPSFDYNIIMTLPNYY